MTEEIQNSPSNAVASDLQGLEVETFKIDELANLDVDATAVASSISISLCSSTTSSSCG